MLKKMGWACYCGRNRRIFHFAPTSSRYDQRKSHPAYILEINQVSSYKRIILIWQVLCWFGRYWIIPSDEQVTKRRWHLPLLLVSRDTWNGMRIFSPQPCLFHLFVDFSRQR
jgi:hypothetical protein